MAPDGLSTPSSPVTHGASASDAETGRGRRALISPATVVHIKQAFGGGSSLRSQSRTRALADWQQVRTSGPNATEQGGLQTGISLHGQEASNPRNSVASVLPAAKLVSEPASYLNSPIDPLCQAGESSSEDSHSGDEYTHFNKRRKNLRRPPSTAVPPNAAVAASPTTRLQHFVDFFRMPNLTAQQRGILKCSIAYFVATLFTFVPFLSDLFAAPFDLEGAPVAGAHVIATVATYYNPAKTLGAMFEADIFMLWASLFAFFVCIGSMATAVVLNDLGWHDTSHLAVVVIWLMGSMGLLAWMKVKVGNAQFGSACSMVALILTSVICKEGSIHAGYFRMHAIAQTFATVALGTLISNLVCLLIWRGSATSKLQGDINKTLESFSTLLDLLCRSFLNEDTGVSDATLKRSVEAHRTSFTALKTSLSAAKLELWDYRIQRTLSSYDQVVTSMNKLAQHLNGVRTAVTMERELDAFRFSQARKHREQCSSSRSTDNSQPTDGEIMDSFQEHVGPSLRTLASVLRQALRDVRTSFVHSRAGEKSGLIYTDEESGKMGLEHLQSMRTDLEQALRAYRTAHTKAVKRLYRHYPSNLSDEADFLKGAARPELDSRPNEEVFLIYFFCFSLEEFAKEQVNLVEAFHGIQDEEAKLEQERRVYDKRFGTWATFVRSCDVFDCFGKRKAGHGQTYRWQILRARLLQLMPFSALPADSPFPPVDDRAVTSHSSAQEKRRDIVSRLRRTIWRLGIAVRRPNTIYAIKAGIGCGLMGSLAFDHRTRPTFVKCSGNWAMLSYMVVVATTTGATNFNAFFRIGGTVLGASVATAAWFLLFGHPVWLCIFSFLFSMPCFWVIIVRPKFATSGRFVLLSYNLTALYAYNVRDTNYDVEDIAFHRTVAVTLGTLWGLFVTRYIFPFEARKELRDGISELLLNMGYFYQKVVERVSVGHKEVPRHATLDSEATLREVDERTPLLKSRNGPSLGLDADKSFVDMEMHLQVSLIKLGALLDFSKHEPRLKGPFPVQPYADVLQSCQKMLDALHSMRTVATRPEFSKTVRKELILPTAAERRVVAGNILLFMSLLASDLSLKAPLPPYLPPAEEARRRLIARISDLPLIQQRAVRGTSAFLLFYSYALMEKALIAELEKVGSVFQYLFGVLGDQTAEASGCEGFDGIFTAHPEDEGSKRNSLAATIRSASSSSDSD